MVNKPTARTLVDVEAIPVGIKGLRHWVLWRWEQRFDKVMREPKLTKPPYQPGGSHASSTDPASWVSFDEAVAAYQRGDFSGIGFVLTPETGIVGVDLDHCRDSEMGAIELWAQSIVDRLDSYSEVTPSGTGLRTFALGKLPPGGRKHGNVEVYDSARYLTVTGQHLEGTPTDIMERQAEVEVIHAEVFADRRSGQSRQPPLSTGTVELDDQELIDKARSAANGDKFSRLWAGEIKGYPSVSEADLALCCHLAFWTGGNPARVDRLFRQSGLYRDKWGEKHGVQTYGDMTIAKALEGATVFYQGSKAKGNGAYPDSVPLATLAHRKWPAPMAEEAFCGLAGDVVQAIEPHTEASRESLLINVLVAFGNAINSAPHAVAESDRHGANLNAVLVGETSKSRKGSSWGQIRRLFFLADPEWAANRVMSGLSSGEGLIFAVRDPIEKTEAVREKGRPTGETITYLVDPGVGDKRLLVVEPEFSSVLQVMAREANILSAIIREAWDSAGSLRTMTKNSPIKATGAHISIIGHITRDELLRRLSETEAANGFGNRFLWICTKRARTLPEGGGQPDYGRLVDGLHNALGLARQMGRIERDAETREAWAAVYPDLSEGQPGLFGAITNRAEAQVLRLSVLYAALDGSQVIQLPHLEAALAVWQYAEASARYIFGDATGDPVADRILETLASGEMDRTTIYHLFGRHVKSEHIAHALATLQAAKRVKVERRDSDGGRPREVWTLA